MAKQPGRGLGRGLSALMADVGPDPKVEPRAPDQHVPIERIHPNPNQPRRHFDEGGLDELAASIREKGIIQPLILRPHPTREGDFEIVAGERRWRAAQRAQVHDVPAIVRELDDTEVLELAIIENIQRSDLNPIEEATGFRQLMDRFGHTQEQLATALGKSRSHIANLMRLLGLPEAVRTMVEDGLLTAGHARALVTSDDPEGLARQVIARGLSVRQTEKLAKGGETGSKPVKPSSPAARDADTVALERDLAAALSMPVRIAHAPGQESGTLSISYGSFEELDELCRRLSTVEAGKI